jgi:hypothetical protein
MLVTNFGCSPHFEQRGEIGGGFGLSAIRAILFGNESEKKLTRPKFVPKDRITALARKRSLGGGAALRENSATR